MAYNPLIGSIYHLYTTYILPCGGLYATYHLLREPETTIDKNPLPLGNLVILIMLKHRMGFLVVDYDRGFNLVKLAVFEKNSARILGNSYMD